MPRTSGYTSLPDDPNNEPPSRPNNIAVGAPVDGCGVIVSSGGASTAVTTAPAVRSGGGDGTRSGRYVSVPDAEPGVSSIAEHEGVAAVAVATDRGAMRDATVGGRDSDAGASAQNDQQSADRKPGSALRRGNDDEQMKKRAVSGSEGGRVQATNPVEGLPTAEGVYVGSPVHPSSSGSSPTPLPPPFNPGASHDVVRGGQGNAVEGQPTVIVLRANDGVAHPTLEIWGRAPRELVCPACSYVGFTRTTGVRDLNLS